MSRDTDEFYTSGDEDEEEYALRVFTQNVNYYVRPDIAAASYGVPAPPAAKRAVPTRARAHEARVRVVDDSFSATTTTSSSLTTTRWSTSSISSSPAAATTTLAATATLTSTTAVSSPGTRHTTQPATSTHAAEQRQGTANHKAGRPEVMQATQAAENMQVPAAQAEPHVYKEGGAEEAIAEEQQSGSASPYEHDVSSQVPLLMNDMDAELLQIIAAYYSNKLQRAARCDKNGDTQGPTSNARDVSKVHPSAMEDTMPPATTTIKNTLPMPQSNSNVMWRQNKLTAQAMPRLTHEHATSFMRQRNGNNSAAAPLVLPTTPHPTTITPFATAEPPPRPATASSHTQPQAWMSHTLARLPSYSSTSFVRAYVSDINLSFEPALIVSGLAAAVNMIIVHFLQNHVLDTHDHLGLFLIGSYLIFASYYMVYYFLERFSSSFCRIASQDKKFYIIGNLLKAGILVSITPFAFYHLVLIIVYDRWESNTLRNLGCIYAIPDFIAVIVVKRMRWSTWVHHLCVVAFNYFSIMNNYENENVCRCLVVYAAFSSFAYCVNVLLASRFLGVSPSAAHVLSFVALVVYALCCITNWSWQVYYLRRLLLNGHGHWTVYAYMVLISLVMWDDVILNKWLLHQARSAAFAAAKQQRHEDHPSPHHRTSLAQP